MSSTTDLDRLIATWLGDGPTTAPEVIVERAVAATERVDQRRARDAGTRIGSVHFSLNSMAWAALAIAFVVMTTAIGIGTGVIPFPDRRVDNVPPVSESPVSSEGPRPSMHDGGTTFVAPDGTFQIRMGTGWRRTNGPDPSAVYLASGSTEISLRGADAEGRVRTCDAPAGQALSETCTTSTATSISQLAADIGVPAIGVAPRGPSRSRMSVDGETARVIDYSAYEYPAGNLQSLRYVVTIHDGRAFVIRMWTSSDDGLDDAAELLAGFRFLGPEPDASTDPRPTAAPADGGSPVGVTHAAPDGTFEITLPEAWEQVAGPEPTALYLRGAPNLVVSIRGGDSEGQIRLCDAPAGAWEACPTVRASTLDELSDAIELDGTKTAVWVGPVAFDSELDVELAVTTYLTGGISPPTTVRYVVAMHGGRPFVIRAVQQRSPGNLADLADLLAGFRFVDANGPSRSPDGTYMYPEAGFAYLPSGRFWQKTSGRDPSHLALTGYGLDISVISGDEDGRLRRCTEPAWRGEECELITSRDLETLTAALELSGASRTSRTVAGEPANVIVAAEDASTAGLVARFVIQVAVVHDARPFLIRISGRGERPSIGRFLAGFEFLDGSAEP